MIRKTTSFLMVFAFLIIVISGIAEFISPFGRLTMMIDWKFLGLSSKQWQSVHIVFGLLFMIVGIVHIFLNIRPIKAYLKNRAKKMVVFTKEMILALAITILLFTATIYKLEPIDSFVKLNKSFNNYWIEEFKKDQTR